MNSNKTQRLSVIRASEIGQYTFCSNAWKLQKLGYQLKSPALQKGEKAHYRLGTQIESIDINLKLSRTIVKISLILLIISMVIIIGWVI